MDINKIAQMNNTSTPNTSKTFTMLEDLYQAFVKKINKSDFNNSPNRYISELTYVQNLKKEAQKHNIQDKIEQYCDLENAIKEKLLKDFGIKTDY